MRRGVVESDLFAAQKEVLQPDARRMDEILAGVIALLAANAEAFYRISPERNLWIVKTFPPPDGHKYRIWYTFDDENVTLLGIEKAEDML